MDAVTADQAPGPDAATRVADVVSVASDFGVAWVVLSAFQVLSRRQALAPVVTRLAASGVVSLALTRCLKHFFGVPRAGGASAATLARTPTSSGFPSGHTLTAFTSALTIPRTSRGRLTALTFAALVGWARVKVGHHRLGDVVAGAGAGAIAGGLLCRILHRPGTAS